MHTRCARQPFERDRVVQELAITLVGAVELLDLGISSTASFTVSEKFGWFGMSFASASVSDGRKPNVRPTSLIAARDFIVPNVTICPTASFPYFSRTYSITSPRRSKQKSTSMSGIDTRSGFRNARTAVVLERADVGDAERIRDERPRRRAAARPTGMPRSARP
jgi:hypothetical protein